MTLQRYAPAYAAAAVLLILAVPQAKADLFSFQLTSPNPAIAAYPGPYANVQVNRTDATHATITFTALSNGTNQYLLGDQGSAAINSNGAATMSAITGTSYFPGSHTLSDGGSNTEDGFGVFSNTIDTSDG